MSKITVIGGINIDIEGSPFNELKCQDSNPGKISLSYGGVGRNIVENIARLGGEAAMLSVIGSDHLGKAAKEELKNLGVEVSMVEEKEGRETSMYLSILDEKGDMEVAISDMGIIDEISRSTLEKHMDRLLESKAIALDGNLSVELLDFATEKLGHIPLFYDPVSYAKAGRCKACMGRFWSIKPNIMEAEALLDMKITDSKDVERAAELFIEKGVKQVFITLNKDGVFYMDKTDRGFIRPKNNLKLISATGAGDSFSAVILLGMAEGKSAKEIAKLGMCAAEITMEDKSAVNKNISIEEVYRRIK